MDPGTPTPASRTGSAGAKRGRKHDGSSTGGTNSPRSGVVEVPTVHWAPQPVPTTSTIVSYPTQPATAAPPIDGLGADMIQMDDDFDMDDMDDAMTLATPGIMDALPFAAAPLTAANRPRPIPPTYAGITNPAVRPRPIPPTYAGIPNPPIRPRPIPPAMTYRQAAALAAPGPASPALHYTSGGVGDDEEDEYLPAMADDDYSAQLNWQSQSKDNLKVLMENLSPEQYDRFEAYRRHALSKQAVRKVIQQSLGQQVSQPIAQIVAGFSKVFVGEIIERARLAQARQSPEGAAPQPLSPDNLREAYRMYQEETGRVGAARPLRGKKLFVR